ncbi:MAG: nitroreductase family protein [Anaerolineae bacterium]
MNETIRLILNRRSVRVFEKKPVGAETRAELLQATLRAPTAGKLMLYSIIDVQDQAVKNTLAKTCDNQLFIARSPLVWIYLADYQRWFDYYNLTIKVDAGAELQKPAEADLLLACCDALIAAQTTVIAAEALGLGSCYIGDIMENYEVHRDLLKLPRYTFPVAMLCLGYPTKHQQERALTTRFAAENIVFTDRYHQLSSSEFEAMFAQDSRTMRKMRLESAESIGEFVYRHKFTAAFTQEMRRSVKEMLRNWA